MVCLLRAVRPSEVCRCRHGAGRSSTAAGRGARSPPAFSSALSRMDEGNFDMQLAWLAPAHKANPFQLIQVGELQGFAIVMLGGEDEEDAGYESRAPTCANGRRRCQPDVEPEADAAGQGGRTHAPNAPCALNRLPHPPPERRATFSNDFLVSRVNPRRARPQRRRAGARPLHHAI